MMMMMMMMSLSQLANFLEIQHLHTGSWQKLNIRTCNPYFPAEREYVAAHSAKNQKVGSSAWKRHSTNSPAAVCWPKGLQIQGITQQEKTFKTTESNCKPSTATPRPNRLLPVPQEQSRLKGAQ